MHHASRDAISAPNYYSLIIPLIFFVCLSLAGFSGLDVSSEDELQRVNVSFVLTGE